VIQLQVTRLQQDVLKIAAQKLKWSDKLILLDSKNFLAKELPEILVLKREDLIQLME
jgi:hypothetical protein